MLTKTLLSTALVLTSLLVVATPATVSAQANASGLAISPPSYELSANPGDMITNTIRVDNLQDKDLEVSVDVRNFTALGEEGQVNLTEDDAGTYSLSKWVKVTPTTSTIAAKDSKTFNYTVTIPANTEPGGRFGSIVFKTSAKPLQGQSGVSIGQEIGSLLFLKIAGNVKEQSTIAEFSSVHAVNQYKPVDFVVRAKNTGNVHLKPTGTVTITNFFGKKVATIPLESHNILPGAIRKMDAQWRGSKFIFGRYTATASVVYGSNRQIVTASTTFWGLPYTIMLVVLGLLLLLGLVLFRGRKRIRLALRALSGKS